MPPAMTDCSLYTNTLLALALGDAYGRPYEVEEKPPSPQWQILDPDSLHGIEVGGRIAYSDDTETTLILAESIIEACGFNPTVFARKLAEKADIMNPVRGYGTAVAAVVSAMRRGTPWWIAARTLYGGQGSAGNGALVRVLPIPLYYHHSQHTTQAMAVAQALVTHTNPLAVEGARLAATIYHHLLQGQTVEEAAEKAAQQAAIPAYQKLLLKAVKEKPQTPVEAARTLGNTALAHHTLAAAVHIAARSQGDPLKTLSYAVSLGGDVDSIAAVALAITVLEAKTLGPLEKHAARLENQQQIADLGEKLCRSIRACTTT